MAITYVTAAQPKWVMINNIALLAGGAKLFSYSSKTFQPKPIYMDSGGNAAYPNPLIFDANGTAGPLFFLVDSANPDDNYFLQAKDRDGNQLWTVNPFVPGSGGGGGGGNVTNYISLQNYLANSVFIDHIPDTASPTNTTNLVIAPSNHQGFTPADANPVIGTYGVVGPDIRFVKSGTTATDQITFVTFDLADNPFIGDVTPVEYLRYQCTVLGGDTYKNFQFPITQKVKNLSTQAMTFQCWAKVDVTPVTLTVYTRQYYGNGAGATAESGTTRQVLGTMNLTNAWTRFNIQFNMPNVGGNTIGAVGSQTNDDAVYLQIEMPLSNTCDVSFTKPALHLGTISPDLDFDTYDQIDAINLTPRTGDIRTSMRVGTPLGWVAMNDGSIGNIGSGATNRANKDTFQLYKTIWDSVIDTWAPVSTGRGANAIADFLANKVLTLPRTLGRALAGFGAGTGLTSRALGQYLGTETIAIADMPAHTHPPLAPSTQFVGLSAGSTAPQIVAGATPLDFELTTGSTGGSAADGKMQPTTFQNVFIKL